MQFSVLIAVAFIVATIAIATFSPFENLPQYSPQETAGTTTAAATEDGSATDGSAPEDGDSSEEEASDDPQSEESYDDTSDSGSSDNIRGHWPDGEEPPP